jgi:mannose-1-phosphate guanylyltransferase / mannose-6-phosphate isomerase
MIIPVILCGGSGTRLWPLSRTHMPKQLQAVIGEGTMLQQTAQRLARYGGAGDVGSPIVVCNDSHRFLTRRQLTEIGVTEPTLIAEPVGRNTAPALTLAALTITDAEAVMIVMPADHSITDTASFSTATEIAIHVAQSRPGGAEAIATFGVVPTEPSTGYGYLRVGGTSSAHPAAFELSRFIEKPALETAQDYIRHGGYLWNSGLFVVRVSVWLRAIQALAPDMLAACKASLEAGVRVGDDIMPSREVFCACPADSIDYAVMEKLSTHTALNICGAIVPLDAGWSDVGAWDSVATLTAHSLQDGNGNTAVGEAIFENASDNYVRTTGPNAPVIACVGIHGTIVVHTPDAILVTNKQSAQKVKVIPERLAAQEDSRSIAHRKSHRPWGWYDSIGSGLNGAEFQVKHIAVYPGQSLSLQYHHKRAEHWVVVKGVATVTVGDETRDYGVGEHVFIAVGNIHRMENKTNSLVEFIEVQLGDYLGEDDIVRLEDIYMRTDSLRASSASS